MQTGLKNLVWGKK